MYNALCAKYNEGLFANRYDSGEWLATHGSLYCVSRVCCLLFLRFCTLNAFLWHRRGFFFAISVQELFSTLMHLQKSHPTQVNVHAPYNFHKAIRILNCSFRKQIFAFLSEQMTPLLSPIFIYCPRTLCRSEIYRIFYNRVIFHFFCK